MPASPYADLDRPPLNGNALRRALIVPGGLWRRLELRVQTGSTNVDAVAAAREGEPEGLVVVAERQTAGRGRLDRVWSSPARAGIAVSVLLRPGSADEERGWPAVRPSAYGWLPLLAGVALWESVVRLTEADARLKWPNDLLVRAPAAQGIEPGDERKCAGILGESVPDGEGASAVIVGVGLNVTLRADELPDRPAGPPATSLRLAGATMTDRDPLLRALLRGLAEWYGRWRTAGGDPDASGLRLAYGRASGTIGRRVRVLLPNGEELTGLATGLDADARLIVRTPAGDQPVAAGDVLHLR